jgi:hypothetical protein
VTTTREHTGPRGWLAARSDDQLLGLCLAGLIVAVGVFLVVPLAGDLVPMHRLPTNRDLHVEGKDQGWVPGFWLFGVGSFLAAIWLWRSGRRPSWGLLLGGAAVLHLLSLLVPPVHSEDVYAYSFYGAVQHDYGQNPYGAFPDQHPLHPWFPFWSWRHIGPVYGGPFLLLLRGVATLAGPSLLAWVLWMKVILVAAELAGVWLLVRALRDKDPQDRGWPVLLIAWNPMVLLSIGMSAHVDAFLLTLVAGTVLAHRRGRYLLAFLLLAVCFTIKLYMGPLAGLYALWLAGRLPPSRRLLEIARLGALGVLVTVLAYLPFASAGGDLVASVGDVGGHYSSGSAGNIVRRAVTVVLQLFGATQTGATQAGDAAGRWLALAAVAAWTGLWLWRALTRGDRDPLPLMATWFLGYLLLTPWVFYWHEVPLLALVAVIPWGLTSLGAIVLGMTLMPASAPNRAFVGVAPSDARQLLNTGTAFLSRYGGTVAVLLIGWLAQRRARSRAEATSRR